MGAKGNQRLHIWPFGEIVRQLTYKLEEVGIQLVKVNERGTSSNCHICGKKGVRSPRGVFKCNVCKMLINSDINGAYGILNKVKPGHFAVSHNNSFIKIWPHYVCKFESNWSIRITRPYAPIQHEYANKGIPMELAIDTLPIDKKTLEFAALHESLGDLICTNSLLKDSLVQNKDTITQTDCRNNPHK